MINPQRRKAVTAVISLLALVALIIFINEYKVIPLWQQRVNKGVTLEGTPIEGMTRQELTTCIRGLAEEINRAPRNAYLDRDSGEVVAEVLGWQVDMVSTIDKAWSANRGDMVLLELVQLDPELTAEHFNRVEEEIGAFHTWMGGGGGGRVVNIILATASMNNTILLPGDIFSFNTANGPRTAERGYQPAPVIVGNSVVPGLGGGVCQVSSTIYNAVLQAGLEVVERYPHSEPVGYVPPGKDATVSDYLDFRFRNNTDSIIILKAATWGGRVDVRILKEK